MSLNSVNTNVGAMIALQSLNETNADLAATQKRISTGYRVADSTDDGAAYAVAQSVRSVVGALTTANQQLGNVQGLLSTTQSGLNDISNTMASMRDVLVKLDGRQRVGHHSGAVSDAVQVAAGQRQDVHSGLELQWQDADRQHCHRSVARQLGSQRGAQRERRYVRHRHSVLPYNAYQRLSLPALCRCCRQPRPAAVNSRAYQGSGNFISQSDAVGTAAEHGRLGNQLRHQPDQVQQQQDRRVEHRASVRWWMPIWPRNRRSCRRCRSVSSWARKPCRWRTRRRRRC